VRSSPVLHAVRAGLARRRVQAIAVSVVVLVSTGASVLALGLVVDSKAPFNHAFATQRGADVVAAIDSARATPAQLAATGRLPQVTAAAGPFADVIVTSEQAGATLPPLTVAGRAVPGGPVDDITVQSGHWAQQPGQIVLASNPTPGKTSSVPLGSHLTVTGVPGRITLTVVGIASSATSSAGGWVVPGEIARLRPPGTPATAQMLYRFRSAGTAAAIHADDAAVAAALRPGAVIGEQSYLSVQAQVSAAIAVFVPFLVAFGVIGMVMSVLIVGNVVSGAVVAGYRRIGILKSIGFTPGQVVAAYTGLVTVYAVVGCLGGLVLGNVLAAPLLAKTASVYQVGALRVPVWVDVAVPAAMCGLVGISALLPALRAGRLSTVQAIASGRAPRQGRGYTALRLLGRLPLPRPVTIGLAAPFARPARTAVTLTAVLLGATAVTFAVGLSASLSQVIGAISHANAQPVQVNLAAANAHKIKASSSTPKIGPPAQRSIQAALGAQPGTQHYVAQADEQAAVAGLSGQVPVTAFRGDAGWTGYVMISGRWYSGPGQVDVPTYFLTATGKTIGDTITITFGGQQIPVRIVGEVFDLHNKGLDMITDWQTLARTDHSLAPDQYDIGLRPGTSAAAYTQALTAKLGSGYTASLNNGSKSGTVTLMTSLVGSLTLLLTLVAGLGVLNTVVLHTRERVHDLGIFKAIGMTPRQAIAMVVCWVAGIGLAAGVIAVPAGIAMHRYVVPIMISSVGSAVPPSFLNIYHWWELAALALAGLVIAVTGALLPASWAAQIRTATALRTE
jgi:putative ABC transport system permease protein